MKHEEVAKLFVEVLEECPDWDTAYARAADFLTIIVNNRCEDCGHRVFNIATTMMVAMKEAEEAGISLEALTERVKRTLREHQEESKLRDEVEQLLDELGASSTIRFTLGLLPPQQALELLKQRKLDEELEKGGKKKKGLSGFFSID